MFPADAESAAAVPPAAAAELVLEALVVVLGEIEIVDKSVCVDRGAALDVVGGWVARLPVLGITVCVWYQLCHSGGLVNAVAQLAAQNRGEVKRDMYALR